MTVRRRRSSSRRAFMARSLAWGGAVAVPGRVLGLGEAASPSERIVMGGIGFGPRGQYVLSCMLPEKDVRFVAVCDAQRGRRERAKQMVDERNGDRECAVYRDMFELLERPDIDAVLVATGDRWHALASILCAKAGKDVYSEKPCGLTIGQVQDLADAMHRTGCVFQAGTQRRSQSNFQFAVELARTGKLGRLRTLHASVYRPGMRYDWLPAEPEPPREECDWDRWLGPSPWRPYHHTYVEGGWRGHYDFEAGSNFLDWGAHTVDLCQWANQADHTTPIEFEANAAGITARYSNGVTLICDFLADAFGDRSPHYRTSTGTCPVRFEGDEGWVETGDSGEIALAESLAKTQKRSFSAPGTSAAEHARNFFDCVKSRALTTCNSAIMRRSHIACFAASLSWQLGRKLTLDPVKEEFVGDGEANRLRRRAMREPWHV